ncbi:hypothetical protein [Enterovirga aerilata]|uniref:Uncharacterized protein n=1 Tax=Enterovirga aerilata TaxID=2730920 RepID=A0A849I5X7_9HYPH|nr:hypothetical protein [Enterovirga sp. DB1703]NNM72788.1 hypothetical protein [Enterovirga sp. DB1703]
MEIADATRTTEQIERPPQEAGWSRQFRDLSDWMGEALGTLSAAETVALSAIIAAGFLLAWRAAR